MDQILQDISLLKQSRGGRIGSSQFRNSIEQAQDFTGLEENINRYDLLLLVKRTGKHAGFTPRMTALLDYYMSFTREIDWEQGSSPIIYQSLSKTALDIGVSERQIQRLEQSLFEAGALTWHDSGNHRRYGKRDDKTGRILYAYGVDLTPLAYLKCELTTILQEKRLYDEAWMETKRQISYYRAQIRAIMSEMEILILEGQGDYITQLSDLQKSYDPLAIQIRTNLSLQDTRKLLASHVEALNIAKSQFNTNLIDSSLKQDIETKERSPKNDKDVIDYNYTIKQQSNKLDTNRANAQGLQKSNSSEISIDNNQTSSKIGATKPQKEGSNDDDLILKTGLQHITLKQALNAASDKFREHMPMESRPMNWNDFIDTAYNLKKELSISQSSWAKACGLLGRSGAAICLLLTEQAQNREHNPVYKTGAYFNAMINRAKTGDLNLHSSIFGILKKEYGDNNEQ